MRYILIAIAILSGLSASISYAQNMATKHFTERDGLPAATVYNVIQDRQGFMWMSTPAGVSRFDGKKFTNFSMNDGLAENEIMKVAQDSKGRIWFLGFNGTLSYYLNGKFFSSANDRLLKKLRRSSSYFHFFEDTLHRLWFTSQTGYTVLDGDSICYTRLLNYGIVLNSRKGASIFYGDKVQRIDTISGKNERLVTVSYKLRNTGFHYLPDGGVLYCSEKGFIRQRDTIQQFLGQIGQELMDTRIINLFLDRANLLWVSTSSDGTYCYNFNDLSHPIQHYGSGHTASITQDSEGNIWIATVNDGLYCLRSWDGIKMQCSASTGLANDNVLSVAKGNDGTIYAGFAWGNISIINGSKVHNLFINRPEHNYNPIARILVNQEYVFLGSNNGLIRMKVRGNDLCEAQFYSDIRKTRYTPAVKDICFYKNGMATSESQMVSVDTAMQAAPCSKIKFTLLDKQSLRRYAIRADKKGILWFSDINGLNSYSNGEIVTHAIISTHISESIRSIAETIDSALVLATYGQGVFFFKQGKIVARFTEKDGLANDICKRVFVHKDNIYVATISGLTVFRYNAGSITSVRNYNTANGLVADNVNDVYADDSDVCIATTGGITVVNEQAALQPAPAPPLYITGVSCGDSVLNVSVSGKLHYSQNTMHFEYIGISYKSADNVRYEYRLSSNHPWTGTKNTTADFPYLPPGDYRFEVRARISNGPWGEPRHFTFTITPPFWKTNWFIALTVLAVIGLAVGIGFYIVRRQNRKRNRQLAIEHQVATLEQQALQAMMNPHFVFNIMNSIQHFINNNEQHQANLYLSDFARLIRMNMDISSRRLISLDEEIAYLQLYLSMERLRFGDRLVYAVNITEDIDTDETMIPVMMLQPFVENALLHGILPLKGQGHLNVDIRRQGAHLLKVTVTDDGVGISTETKIKTHESKGMKMTHQRLALLGKLTNHELYIKTGHANPQAENKGTKVEIVLPSDLS